MPKYARPRYSEHAEDPIKALGNMVRAGIIGFLRTNGPASRVEISRELEIPIPTVAKSLAALMESGLLLSDPPMEEVRQGQRVRYRVNDSAVSDMYTKLGMAIGEL
ncbi:winged helix-turn-helix domain-containing protein [Microbacterium sp. LRZ72]|uniref:ArsR/SmtB family transcription factor n=1 Tax=Microbacterium sp. LRZ72 TaxID=2942481 RepID=UPI00299FF78C|nr:winged helix-turn-helix domain-containing protein [Microbacterium sp. LRZ72]MDX2377601.1 winged helix-turn-helix domain-containing protein [Microbacterium sp. LRZ72]